PVAVPPEAMKASPARTALGLAPPPMPAEYAAAAPPAFPGETAAMPASPPAHPQAWSAPPANPFAAAAAAAGGNPFASAPPGMMPAPQAAAPVAAQPAYAAPQAQQVYQAPQQHFAAAHGHDDHDMPEGTYTYTMLKSGPDVSPDEVELAHVQAVEVMILWGSNVIYGTHLITHRIYYEGVEPGTPYAVDSNIPA